jgi:hypothetical protein
MAFTILIEYPFNNIKDLILNNKKSKVTIKAQCDKTDKLKSF